MLGFPIRWVIPLTVTVTTMGNRSYNSPLNKAPLRTVTERGNDPTYTLLLRMRLLGFQLLGFYCRCFCSPATGSRDGVERFYNHRDP